jgi:hypothetical protein
MLPGRGGTHHPLAPTDVCGHHHRAWAGYGRASTRCGWGSSHPPIKGYPGYTGPVGDTNAERVGVAAYTVGIRGMYGLLPALGLGGHCLDCKAVGWAQEGCQALLSVRDTQCLKQLPLSVPTMTNTKPQRITQDEEVLQEAFV